MRALIYTKQNFNELSTHSGKKCITISNNNMPQTFHRRNLPHLYDNEGTYFITYRLANSIPIDMLKKLEHNSAENNFYNFRRLFQKYDSLLDAGNGGVSYLGDDKIAEFCKSTLHYQDNKDYNLICYTIMPNHVHLVFTLRPRQQRSK